MARHRDEKIDKDDEAKRRGGVVWGSKVF